MSLKKFTDKQPPVDQAEGDAEVSPEMLALAEVLEENGIDIDALADEDIELIVSEYVEILNEGVEEGDDTVDSGHKDQAEEVEAAAEDEDEGDGEDPDGEEDDGEGLGVVNDDAVWDAIAAMSDEEVATAVSYLAEIEKFDNRLEGAPMEKADAMADVWLQRGDVDLKKFIGGATAAAGRFAGAVRGRVGAASANMATRGGNAGYSAGNKLAGLMNRARGRNAIAGAATTDRFRGAGRKAGAFAGRHAIAGGAAAGAAGAGAFAANRRK